MAFAALEKVVYDPLELVPRGNIHMPRYSAVVGSKVAESVEAVDMSGPFAPSKKCTKCMEASMVLLSPWACNCNSYCLSCFQYDFETYSMGRFGTDEELDPCRGCGKLEKRKSFPSESEWAAVQAFRLTLHQAEEKMKAEEKLKTESKKSPKKKPEEKEEKTPKGRKRPEGTGVKSPRKKNKVDSDDDMDEDTREDDKKEEKKEEKKAASPRKKKEENGKADEQKSETKSGKIVCDNCDAVVENNPDAKMRHAITHAPKLKALSDALELVDTLAKQFQPKIDSMFV